MVSYYGDTGNTTIKIIASQPISIITVFLLLPMTYDPPKGRGGHSWELYDGQRDPKQA